jgi:D-sedoheptulose 7-phosphate isomerase
MDLDQYVTELFHVSIDTSMRSMETLAEAISDGGTLMSQCLLNENKILCAGLGINGSLAQIFASHLLNRFNNERPSLPAVNLSTDASTITSIAHDNSFNDIFALQIRALAQPGDLLLLISNDGNSGTTLQAVKAAHDRGMSVISLSSQSNSDVSALLQTEDLEICIPSDERARVSEVQLQVINYLSELIDQQLFGSY